MSGFFDAIEPRNKKMEKYLTLNNGVKIPQMSYGTWLIKNRRSNAGFYYLQISLRERILSFL